MKTASWVIVSLETGKPVMETFSLKTARRVNTEKYRVVPILEWLVDLNRRIREGGEASV